MGAGEILDVLPQLAGLARLQALGEAGDFVGGAGDAGRAAGVACLVEILGAAPGGIGQGGNVVRQGIALVAREPLRGRLCLVGDLPAFTLQRRAGLLQGRRLAPVGGGIR